MFPMEFFFMQLILKKTVCLNPNRTEIVLEWSLPKLVRFI